MRRLTQFAAIPIIALLVLACSPAPSPTPTGVPTASPSTGGPASAPPSSAPPTPNNTDSVVLGNVPTACWGLGPDDCRRVVQELQSELTAADPFVTYIQVGPFACATGERCPTTLEARPQGDVVLDAAASSVSFHVTATGEVPAFRFERHPSFANGFPPSSTPPLTPGPQPYQLGHCGLWSGIDAGGSWWDPVGQVDADHPDTINAAAGTLNVIDAEHATFVSPDGLVVQLLRRNGPKALPPCM